MSTSNSEPKQPQEIIQTRIAKDKEILLDQLKKTPIIALACEKTGTSRATFYRWKAEDPEFSLAADAAISEGSQLINDLAESQLINAIHDGNLGAIVFWLRNHHLGYTNRVEITTKLKTEEKLTPEQEELIVKALELAVLVPATTQMPTQPEIKGTTPEAKTEDKKEMDGG